MDKIHHKTFLVDQLKIVHEVWILAVIYNLFRKIWDLRTRKKSNNGGTLECYKIIFILCIFVTNNDFIDSVSCNDFLSGLRREIRFRNTWIDKNTPFILSVRFEFAFLRFPGLPLYPLRIVSRYEFFVAFSSFVDCSSLMLEEPGYVASNHTARINFS